MNNFLYEDTTTNDTAYTLTVNGTTGSINTMPFWKSPFDMGKEEELSWLPYHYTKYVPKWHIELRYKMQMKKMWD